MQYLGGKARMAKAIATILKKHRGDHYHYVEPFVGAANVIVEMDGSRYGYDICDPLIRLLRAIRRGWTPPDFVPRWYYDAARSGDLRLSPEMRAFVLFGSSFGGKWCGGYATSKKQHFAASAQRSLLRKRGGLQGVHLETLDYRYAKVRDCLIYADPPYEGTTGYATAGTFNSAEFWEVAREWARASTVIVSGYEAPKDWLCIAAWDRPLKLQNEFTGKRRVEKLFKWMPPRRRPLLARTPLYSIPGADLE